MTGVVIQQSCNLYTVEVEGKLLKRHVNHLRQWIDSASPSATSVNDHTIQDNFTYSESYPDAPQDTSGEDEGLEDSSHRYPRRQTSSRSTYLLNRLLFSLRGEEM